MRLFYKWLWKTRMRARGSLHRARLAVFPRAARKPGGRVVILDPNLTSDGGHHLPVATALWREARRLGYEAVVVGHAKLPKGASAVSALPYFFHAGYTIAAGQNDQDVAQRIAAGSASLAAENAQLLIDLSNLPRDWFGESDFILFPAVTPNQILAIGQWISGFAASASPCWGLSLLLPPDFDGSEHLRNVGSAYARAAFELIPAQMKKRIVVAAETAALAQSYAGLVGLEPVVLRLPLHADLDEAPCAPAVTVSPKCSAPLVASLGFANDEKGYHLLPDILPRVYAARPDARFLVHISGRSRKWVDSIRSRLALLGDSVTVVGGPVSQERMTEMLKSTSLILLPYDPVTYRERGSGLFQEALRFAIPVVLPANTAIAAEARSFGSTVEFERQDASCIAEATIAALDRLDNLSAAARRHSAESGIGRRGYLETLLSEFPDFNRKTV